MNIPSVTPVQNLEMQEIKDKLIANGFGKYVDCLLENDADCYTKKGRLNKSATIRKLGCKGKELEDALKAMKELLKPEFDWED